LFTAFATKSAGGGAKTRTSVPAVAAFIELLPGGTITCAGPVTEALPRPEEMSTAPSMRTTKYSFSELGMDSSLPGSTFE